VTITLLSPDLLAVALLALVTAQRLAELVIAKRNTAALLAAGGIEHGPGHYPFIVAVHTVWLIGLWLLAGGIRPDPVLAGLYLAVQGLRLWTLASLGRRWTTRIVTVPGEILVARGPYRYVRHPNYVVVAIEIALLPLAFGLGWFALLFSVLNGCVLVVRLAAEERALAESRRRP